MRRLGQPGRRTKHLEKLRERTPDALLSSEEWNVRTEARVHTITAVFRSLATAFIWFVATVWILDVIGVNFGPLIAGAGIVGVALGFGTQTMVRDFIAGFFLVVEDQYGVGDTVDLGGEAKGTVEAITLRSTRLRDVEGNVWWVPNGQLTRVANKSHEWARALIDVVVPYQADLDAGLRPDEGRRRRPHRRRAAGHARCSRPPTCGACRSSAATASSSAWSSRPVPARSSACCASCASA